LEFFFCSAGERSAMKYATIVLCHAIALSLAIPITAVAVTIETVAVGDPGNAADTSWSHGNYGAVDYSYRIGKYEVTNDQYAAFLNAVASMDTHGLYNSLMTTHVTGGIVRSGNSGSYFYEVKPNMGNKHVNMVNFWDAARFVNWLNNGQRTGPQDATTTEDGTYFLNGVTLPDNALVVRKPGATWFLPTDAEWYKAAYYQPTSQGGDSESYWRYATRSNSPPAVALADSIGNIANPGSQIANSSGAAECSGSTPNGNVTTVGSAGPLSASYYGTFDQAGNVAEWNEGFPTGVRVVRAGGFGESSNVNAASGYRSGGMQLYSSNWGFRVATLLAVPPIPGDADSDGDVDGADFVIWQTNFGNPTTGIPPVPGDFDGDADCDGADFVVWQTNFPFTPSAALVPEPSATLVALLCLPVFGFATRRRLI
jgi:formylglycine-generating enzyme required for sulfatase activity